MRYASREPSACWACGHQSDENGPHCDREATWHGFAIRGHKIDAMMASCDDHLERLKANADYVHPMAHPCAIPGSVFRWPENECVIEWDDAAEFAAASTAQAALAKASQ